MYYPSNCCALQWGGRANKSLDASGSASRNLNDAAEGALIRAAASTQPLGDLLILRMKRKVLYSFIVVGLIVIGSLWYVPTHTWSARLMDGASGEGFGPSGRGVGFSTATWTSMTGATVEEMVVNYSSTNDARNDFEAELKNGGTVIERSDSTNVNYQRAVKVFGDANTQGASEIITLSDQQIQFVKAGALKYALRFEKSWLNF